MDPIRSKSPRPLTQHLSSQLTAQLEQSQPRNISTAHPDNIDIHKENSIPKPSLLPAAPVESTSRCATPLPAPSHNTKNDDSFAPVTPHRKAPQTGSLSLQVPQRLLGNQPNAHTRTPSSPKLDSAQIYTSPSSVLPRRSRGLDFARASTNLHHSTLAEASPDSSPVVSGRGVTIPKRRSIHGCGFASPSNSLNHWSAPGHGERNVISSSVSSINMFDSDSSSCSDEEDDLSALLDRGENVMATPQPIRTSDQALGNADSSAVLQNLGRMQELSSTKPSLMSFQRARYRGRTRHSSTSTSGASSRPSPGPKSPPTIKSVDAFPSGYFSREAIMADVKSRRESLSLGTSDLHLSDVSDDGETKPGVSSSSSGSMTNGPNSESVRRGVIRRAVTRRGNLLPKTKTFARIKAALFEEGAPIESEAKKEAEVIRQVRESDSPLPPLSPTLTASDMPSGSYIREKGLNSNVLENAPSSDFSQQASENSGGVQFWNSFDRAYQTPSPSLAKAKPLSKDTIMQTPPCPSTTPVQSGSTAVQPRPLGPQAVLSQAATDLSQRLSKRRRVDDLDLDLASFKRRAVSPGTSAQSSPGQPQTFSFPDTSNSGHVSKPKICSGSTQSTNSGHPQPLKRVGLQGMNETNEGLMNMSID